MMNIQLLLWGNAGWGDEMLVGAFMTLAVSVCAYAVGIVLGSIAAALKLSRFLGFRLVGSAVTAPLR